MHKRSFLKWGAAAFAAAFALAACGERGDNSSSDGSNGDGDKTLTIGVISPTTGDLSALGLGIKNSVDLAVKQANESGDLGDWTLEIEAEDDEGKADAGRNAATKLTSNDDVVAVVGPLNSSVGQTIQQVMEDAGVALVSPANTNPELTRGKNFADSPERMYDTYFRTCTTDAIQGPFAARYLFETAGIKEVATIHDNKAYGKGLVDAFAKEFEELGGTIVAAEQINPEDANYAASISAVKGGNPKAVYYGGEYPQSGPLSQQMKTAGLNVPLMGGDGMYTPKFIELAGATSEGDLATSVGAPTEDLASAKKFVEDYDAAGYADAYEAYGAYSYDAATAIIEALKAADPSTIENAEDARAKILENLGSVSFDGTTGKVAFDEFGDNTSRVLTVYQVTDGAWKAVETKDFE